MTRHFAQMYVCMCGCNTFYLWLESRLLIHQSPTLNLLRSKWHDIVLMLFVIITHLINTQETTVVFFFYSLWFLSCFPKYPLILQISFLFLSKRRLQPFFKLKQIWYKGANQIVCSSDLFLSFFCLVLILKLYFHCRFVFKCYGYFLSLV